METIFMVLAVAFGVGMILLLPKYARFIHEQPHLHREQMLEKTKRQAEEEAAKEKSGGE